MKAPDPVADIVAALTAAGVVGGTVTPRRGPGPIRYVVSAPRPSPRVDAAPARPRRKRVQHEVA